MSLGDAGTSTVILRSYSLKVDRWSVTSPRHPCVTELVSSIRSSRSFHLSLACDLPWTVYTLADPSHPTKVSWQQSQLTNWNVFFFITEGDEKMAPKSTAGCLDSSRTNRLPSCFKSATQRKSLQHISLSPVTGIIMEMDKISEGPKLTKKTACAKAHVRYLQVSRTLNKHTRRNAD